MLCLRSSKTDHRVLCFCFAPLYILVTCYRTAIFLLFTYVRHVDDTCTVTGSASCITAFCPSLRLHLDYLSFKVPCMVALNATTPLCHICTCFPQAVLFSPATTPRHGLPGPWGYPCLHCCQLHAHPYGAHMPSGHCTRISSVVFRRHPRGLPGSSGSICHM